MDTGNKYKHELPTSFTWGVPKTGDHKRPADSLHNDLRKLLKEGLYADLILTVGDEKLKVHKAIVLARSPALAAMLDMATNHDELNIQDVDLETMKRIVHYMYTDQVDDIDVNTGELYLAACRFALQDLRDLCERTLENCLTVENAAQTLVVVHPLSKELRSRVNKFIETHFQEVSVTVGFQSAVTAHHHLFVEVFCRLHQKHRP